MEAGNAQKIYDVFTHMKTPKKTHKDTQVRSSDPSTLHVARLRHPPRRVTGSNSRRSRPQRSEPNKETPSGKETWETLEEMGFSGDGSSRSECQNVSQHPMLLMSIGAVLVLLVLTPHPCQADSKSGTAPAVQLAHPTNYNLSQRTTFECATPAQRGIESLTDCRPHMQSASEFCVHSNSLSLRTSRSEQSA